MQTSWLAGLALEVGGEGLGSANKGGLALGIALSIGLGLGIGAGVRGLRFGVWSWELRFSGSGFRDSGFGVRVSGSRFGIRVSESGVGFKDCLRDRAVDLVS